MEDLRLEGPVEFQGQEIKKNFCLDYTIVKIKNTKEKMLIVPERSARFQSRMKNQIDIRFSIAIVGIIFSK